MSLWGRFAFLSTPWAQEMQGPVGEGTRVCVLPKKPALNTYSVRESTVSTFLYGSTSDLQIKGCQPRC